MESKSKRNGILVIVALTLFIILISCSDDPTKPDSDGDQPPEGFVAIPADTFTMGSPADEIDRFNSEMLHKVTLTTPFYMFATEVTNQQYAEMARWAYNQEPPLITATTTSLSDALDGSTQELLNLDDSNCEISFTRSRFTVDSGKEEHPVSGVTWYGAVAYCDWLSLREGISRAYDHSTWQCNGNAPYKASGYRLPTEAEWEYGCRVGTQTPFNTGGCLGAGTEANYGGDSYSGCPSGSYEGWTVPVGSYPANTFDLYDMHGNLWEWCNDWFEYDYSGNAEDPVGPSTGTHRVIRGGCWISPARYCRSALRGPIYPAGSRFIGFRPVRSIF